MSLVEVLIATVIIGTAIYGMILALGAQDIAETRLRQDALIKQLQGQYLGEIMSGERLPLDTNNTDGNPSGSVALTNPALGGLIVSATDQVTETVLVGQPPFLLQSSFTWSYGQSNAGGAVPKNHVLSVVYMP